jgi:aspartate carbamoyltransferase catalytic subunit
MKGKDILSAFDFDKDTFLQLFKDAEVAAQREKLRIAEDKTMITAFFEPSTRTRLSFTSAMLGLGGKVIDMGAAEATALMKGESFEDTIRMLDGYKPDVIVLRHKAEGSARKAADLARSPVINAGDGTNEHPTQALTDLYTMWKIFGKIDGLKVGLLGDLKHSRTTSSLSYALSMFENIELIFIAPRDLRMRQEVLDKISGRIKFSSLTSIDELMDEIDVLYVTRVQRERFLDPREYEKIKKSYVVNLDFLSKLKKIPIIMHPLPRVDELAVEVDSLPQAKYFEQAANGVYVRMALLAGVLGLRIPQE